MSEIILNLNQRWSLPLALFCLSKCVSSLCLARGNSLVFCLFSYSDKTLPIFCLCNTVLIPYIICNYIYGVFYPIILLQFWGFFYFFLSVGTIFDFLFLELGNLKVNGINFVTLYHFLRAFMSWFLHPYGHLYISLYLSLHTDIWNR